MPYKFYEYKNCSTCRKAKKYLKEEGVTYQAIPIRETPPTKAELKKMLKIYDGEVKKLFNTSGQDYRSLGLKDKIAIMSEAEALDLLSQNGNLVKRPFILSKNWGAVGFKAEIWEEME